MAPGAGEMGPQDVPLTPLNLPAVAVQPIGRAAQVVAPSINRMLERVAPGLHEVTRDVGLRLKSLPGAMWSGRFRLAKPDVPPQITLNTRAPSPQLPSLLHEIGHAGAFGQAVELPSPAALRLLARTAPSDWQALYRSALPEYGLFLHQVPDELIAEGTAYKLLRMLKPGMEPSEIAMKYGVRPWFTSILRVHPGLVRPLGRSIMENLRLPGGP